MTLHSPRLEAEQASHSPMANVSVRALRSIASSNRARVALICFPCAGASASFYDPWRHHWGETEDVYAVQLPGREDRFGEQRFACPGALAETVALEIADRLPDLPLVVFGHSFGALVAFETALALLRLEHTGPHHILVSSRIAPHLPFNSGLQATFDDNRMIRGLSDMEFEPRALLGNADLLRMFLPVLRSDLILNDGSTRGPAQPLSCPVTIIAGTVDRLAPPHLMQGWRHHTVGKF